MAVEGVVAGVGGENSVKIHDNGFVLTEPLYNWLGSADPFVLHSLAFVNTLVCQILTGLSSLS